MTSNFALLTGAGYSKNWGSWLASELWAVILSHPLVQQDGKLKNIIWKYRSLGFEEAFGDKEIEKNYKETYQTIIKDSFLEMHEAVHHTGRGFDRSIMDFHNLIHGDFLHKFNTIFTLNQDLFFEATYPIFQDLSSKYYYPHVKSRSYFQYGIPRHAINGSLDFNALAFDATLVRDAEPFDNSHNPLSLMSSNPQAIKPIKYYKLHGSLNFKESNSDIMVMGSSKSGQIDKIPLLKKYHQDFSEILSNTKKLMVVGYSFADHHINKRILDAVNNNNLRLWIIDICDLEKLINNAVNAEIKNDNPEMLPIELGGKGLTDYPTIKKEEHLLEIQKKYNDFFKKGLISVSRDSLRNIFSTKSLESKRIRDRFFN